MGLLDCSLSSASTARTCTPMAMPGLMPLRVTDSCVSAMVCMADILEDLALTAPANAPSIQTW
jgi:hypothetical protein